MARDVDDPPELKYGDLVVMQGLAVKEFNNLPAEVRLPGMKRALDHGERLALSWLRASTVVLNSAGGFREGFLNAYRQPLETPDSFPATEDPDWEQADDGKVAKKKP